ncbi:MAG: hypothetical protein AAF547_05700 [Actinomycetota bacterium]
MFRGRSDGQDDDSRPKGPSATPRSQRPGGARAAAKPSRRNGQGQPTADPRSGPTGKKIRRIESGAPPGRTPRPADPTDLGGPPSRPPSRRPLDPADTDRSAIGRRSERRPSLPPLRQPTGEHPRIPERVSPEDTVVVAGGESAAGVFGHPRGKSDGARRLSAVPDPGAAAPDDEPMPPDPMPTAFPPPDDAPWADPMPAVPSAFPEDQTEVDGYAAIGAATTGEVNAMDSYDFGNEPQSPAMAAAGPRRAPADGTRPMARPGPSGYGDGPPGRGVRPVGIDRPQDTEFKLADNRRRRQKPKEPNRALLGLGLAAIVLAGLAAAWFLTRDGGDESADDAAVATEADQAAVETTLPATPAVTEAPEPVVSEPTLFFDAATAGPLQQGETYSIDLVGEPDGSLLQVVVDDIPQGQPDALLPDLILPAGRHSLFIEITNGVDVSSSTPIELYVLGDPPPVGWRVNLSSVDMQTEGWAEAIRQFDEFRAAGHEGLQLLPLSPGFWNIFISGFGEDRGAAQGYCESFNLAVPDECFPVYFEGAPAADTPDTQAEDTTADDGAMTDGEGDAMTDGEDTTSTTAAGG